MEGNFDRCLPVILREEGGNDDDPHDHGGRTSRGILQREYNAYRQRLGKPLGDVWNASAAEIRDIYLTQYWRPWCDKLPLGLDLAYFDFAVTAGGVQATRTLQRALGNVAVDGRMGIITLRAIENVPHIAPLIREFSERKRAFYRALEQFPRYGKGWLARTSRIERAAIAMARDDLAPGTPLSVPGENRTAGTAKAKGDETAEAVVSPEKGAIAATAGTAATGTLQEAHDQLAPLGYSLRWLQIILIVLTLAILGLTLYGLWKRHKAKEAT